MHIKSKLAGAALGAMLAMGIGSAGLAFAQSSDSSAPDTTTTAPAQASGTDNAPAAAPDAAGQATDPATNPDGCPNGAMGAGPGAPGQAPAPLTQAPANTNTSVQL